MLLVHVHDRNWVSLYITYVLSQAIVLCIIDGIICRKYEFNYSGLTQIEVYSNSLNDPSGACRKPQNIRISIGFTLKKFQPYDIHCNSSTQKHAPCFGHCNIIPIKYSFNPRTEIFFCNCQKVTVRPWLPHLGFGSYNSNEFMSLFMHVNSLMKSASR